VPQGRTGPRRLGKGLLIAAAVLGVTALGVLGVRAVNGWRYPEPAWSTASLADALATPEAHPGLTIERVTGDYLAGYHLRPQSPAYAGLVVTWGGSEGGANDPLALRLADLGHEVLALHFFGQANQRPVLSQVPLESFGEALAYSDEYAVSSAPLTVIGLSKGAELALVLPAYYTEIDNVVVYTPGEYVYGGLDFASPHSSWTWQGAELPYVNFRHAAPEATVRMLSAMALNVPVRLRETYVTAVERDPDAERARIDVSRIRGHLLAFAGDDDRMWQGDVAARNLATARPEKSEVHVYAGAGHVFGLPGAHASGYELGGSADANAAALAESTAILEQRLSEWHR
jgi:dienelactone hydrolase